MIRSRWAMLVGAALLGAVVVLLYLNRHADRETVVVGPRDAREAPLPADHPPREPPTPMPELAPRIVDEPTDPAEALAMAGVGERLASPEELVGRIGRALGEQAWGDAASLLGSAALTPENRRQLAALAEAGRLRGLGDGGEVGEIGRDRVRWTLRLDGGDDPLEDRILLDLGRDEHGRWSVDSLTLPPAAGAGPRHVRLDDPLGIADSFLQAVLRQDFERAHELVDPERVSHAKIAALCILFEEGGYRLRPRKPLRAMLQNEGSAGFLAHVLVGEDEVANIALMVARDEPEAAWRLVEVNLDRLLADYAARVADGDVHYTPLVRNPQGGDTLVLYFAFDEDRPGPRTRRQLDIVAEVLLSDPGRTLTLSGHTDALGSERYNDELSGRRARSVKEYLVGAGVPTAQIRTVAAGQNQPRRPNFTDSGADNPDGRRANRRAEIYLDF